MRRAAPITNDQQLTGRDTITAAVGDGQRIARSDTLAEPGIRSFGLAG